MKPEDRDIDYWSEFNLRAIIVFAVAVMMFTIVYILFLK